jgi:glutathione synthase/RimK-type ligase-like ATP-grasp enzyme
MTELRRVYQERPFFVQPFIRNIQSDGEYSLFFLGGEYSHATRRIPEQGDFRSQEEHGAEVRKITASSEQIDAAERLLALVQPQPTYVRIDMVRDDDGSYLLMELELIEPSLYLRTDEESSRRFARAFDRAVFG